MIVKKSAPVKSFVLFVSFNIPLNLGEEDVSEANVGMLDQRQALVWVQENIAGE